jgi:hypothetical protein
LIVASLWYVFSVRDNSAAGPDTRMTGLAPWWTVLQSLDSGTDIVPQPVIVEVGFGIYKYAYDPEVSGVAVGQVDALGVNHPSGVSLDPSDRYLDQLLTREKPSPLAACGEIGPMTLAPETLGGVGIGHRSLVALGPPQELFGIGRLPSGTPYFASTYFTPLYFPTGQTPPA